MARVRPEPWDETQTKQAEGVMTSFAVSGEDGKATMCDVMGCAPSDLDWLCQQAFGLAFSKARAKYERIGRARIRSAIFQAAEGGNAKMLEIEARMSGLDMGPTQARRRAEPKPKPQPKQEVDF